MSTEGGLRAGRLKGALPLMGALPHPLVLILILALALRLPFAFVPAYVHPDEIFQYIEQGHRLATGYGVIPWEYRAGIRGSLLPLGLAPFVWFHDALGLDGIAYVGWMRAFFVLISLSVVAACYGIGRRFSPTHAIVAGFTGAVWFELVYFSSHTLSETASLAAFMPAAWLLVDSGTVCKRRLVAAGFLLGLTALLRFQLLPAIAVLALFTCWTRVGQAWLPLAAGGLLALLLGAAADVSLGMVPFAWLFANFGANIIDGRSANYGVYGPHFYFGALLVRWSTAAILLAPLALWGARRYPALFAAAVVHLLAHSLVGHKEYRFVLLTSTILVLFASIGLTDLVRWVQAQLPQRFERAIVACGLGFVALNSLVLAGGERYRYRWFEYYPTLAATAAANRVPELCGVALYEIPFFRSGGYSYLHRKVPMYEFRYAGDAAFPGSTPAYNAVLAPPTAGPSLPASYRRVQCVEPLLHDPLNFESDRGGTCLYVRPGPCSTQSGLRDLNAALRLNNE